MKTAISVEAELLTEADRTAHELGLSRSRLFSIALEAYLRDRRQQETLERLNRAYAEKPDPASRTTAKNMKAKFRSTIKDRW
jgi:metal-responsive CopG/Arc/MetJ family transcriptional regulator